MKAVDHLHEKCICHGTHTVLHIIQGVQLSELHPWIPEDSGKGTGFKSLAPNWPGDSASLNSVCGHL